MVSFPQKGIYYQVPHRLTRYSYFLLLINKLLPHFICINPFFKFSYFFLLELNHSCRTNSQFQPAPLGSLVPMASCEHPSRRVEGHLFTPPSAVGQRLALARQVFADERVTVGGCLGAAKGSLLSCAHLHTVSPGPVLCVKGTSQHR